MSTPYQSHRAQIHTKRNPQQNRKEKNVRQPHLIVDLLGSERLLLPDHPGGHEGHDGAVAEVAEHHREQERKRDDGVRRCRGAPT